MNEVVLNVTGMQCSGCVASVQSVLSALPGVNRVEVTLDPGTARIGFDPARVTADDLVQAVISAGFGAQPA